MKKRIWLFFTIPVFLLLIFVTGAYFMFAVQIKAVGTIEKWADDLYYMEYSGDYGFNTFLERGGAVSDESLANYLVEFLSKGLYKYAISGEAEIASSVISGHVLSPEIYTPTETTQGCSTISVRLPDGGYGFGRNFDWEDCTAMIIKTIPPDGYVSISTSNLNFLGFEVGFKPESFESKFMSLAAVYVPLDGMNEKGLCVADLIIDYPEETHQDTGKPNLTTTTAIRLLLDKAATVNEAIALLEQYDMHSSAGMMHHLAIADAGGRSVVIEYIDNVMYVTETPVVTNFFLTQSEVYGIGSEASKQRFDILTRLYDDANGIMSREEIKSGLSEVRQSIHSEEHWNTQWSIVYNQITLEISFYHRENFEAPHNLLIER